MTTNASSELDTLRRDLVDEQAALDEVVGDIKDQEWQRATPSPGWSVADQIGHLTYFDTSAATAIADPDDFRIGVSELVAGATNEGFDTFTLGGFRSLSPNEQLAAWRRARRALADAAQSLRDETRVPWYGPPMSAKSFLSARLMETWAHGIDVASALDVTRPPTERLRHVARLGFITRRWSYQVRGEELPAGDVRLELTSPAGETWTWGPASGVDTVKGPAEEFCLVVTQRRHVDDTSLVAGDLGHHWLVRAQAFAGAASDGPKPRNIA